MRPLVGILLALVAVPLAAQNLTLQAAVDVDVPVIQNQQLSVTGLCSTGPFSASAPIYSVVVNFQPTLAGAAAPAAPFLLFEQDRRNFLFGTFRLSAPVTLPAFQTARKAYPTVAFQDLLGEITISGLNWADVSDVIDTIAQNPSSLQPFFTLLTPRLQLITVPARTTIDLSRADLLAALASPPANLGTFATPEEWQRYVTFVQNATAGTTLETDGRRFTLTSSAPTSTTVASITLPVAARVAQLQEDVALIGPTPANDPDMPTAIQKTNPIVIVDSPCYTVRLLPAVSDNTQSTLEFNGRLLAPWSDGHNFLRAEGRATKPLQGAAGSTARLSGEIAHNWDFGLTSPKLHPRLAFGAIATYDETESATANTRAESIGLKGALSLRNPTALLGVRLLAGEETRPTFTFEAHYANSKATGQNGVRAFDVRSTLKAKFRWSQTSFSRIEAAGSVSREKKFGGRDRFAYVNLDIVRIIIKNPLEVAATYTCGRQPPEYKSDCGFQAGFSIASNQ